MRCLRCVKASFLGAGVAQFTLDFTDRIISPLLHYTILVRSWLHLQTTSIWTTKAQRLLFPLCVSQQKELWL